MEDVEYIKTRVQEQINWYDKKASEFKSKHECINIYSIVFTTGGSLFTICGIIFGFLEPWITIIDAIIGVSVAILLSVDKLKKYEGDTSKTSANLNIVLLFIFSTLLFSYLATADF